MSTPIIQPTPPPPRRGGLDLFDKEDSRFREYRQKWKEWPESFTVGEFPLFLDIEVTSVCNLKCPFCATTYHSDEIEKGFISSKIVKKIIDEGADNGLYGVKFNYRGEPLLHPDIHKFVKYAKNKGLIDVYFNTNALRLTEDIAVKLIDSGLDRISISIEGYTKETYEKNRVGSDFETVLRNVQKLKELKDRLGVEYPLVRIQTVLLPELIDYLAKYKNFWLSWADEVAYLDYKEMKARKKGIAYPWACPQLWQRMQVWWDGTLLPCNHDDEARLLQGNIHKMSIKEGWNSEFLNSVRQKHKEGLAHLLEACDGCYLRDSEIKKLMQEKEDDSGLADR